MGTMFAPASSSPFGPSSMGDPSPFVDHGGYINPLGIADPSLESVDPLVKSFIPTLASMFANYPYWRHFADQPSAPSATSAENRFGNAPSVRFGMESQGDTRTNRPSFGTTAYDEDFQNRFPAISVSDNSVQPAASIAPGLSVLPSTLGNFGSPTPGANSFHLAVPVTTAPSSPFSLNSAFGTVSNAPSRHSTSQLASSGYPLGMPGEFPDTVESSTASTGPPARSTKAWTLRQQARPRTPRLRSVVTTTSRQPAATTGYQSDYLPESCFDAQGNLKRDAMDDLEAFAFKST